MADVSRDTLRGLIVPDRRLSEVWEAQSSYTQADPQVGAVEPSSADSRLSLQASGSMDGGTAVDIKTIRPGHADPGGGGGGYCWKNSTDADTLYRGRDPVGISGIEPIVMVPGGVGGTEYSNPHVVALKNQTVVAAAQSSAPLAKKIVVRTRARNGSWSADIEVYSGSATAQDYHPCLLVLPDQSLILAAWYVDTLAEEANVRLWRSTDDGASWGLHSAASLITPVSLDVGAGYTLRGLSMDWLDGQILLICDTISNNTGRTYQDTYHQFASDSLGARFSFIETGAADFLFGFPRVVSTPSQFLVVYQSYPTTRRMARLLVDAYTPLSSMEEIALPMEADAEFADANTGSKIFTDGDCAACVGPSGAIYVLSRVIRNISGGANINECVITRSDDNGATWEGMGLATVATLQDCGLWYRIGDANTFPTQFSVCESEGRLVIVTRHAANPGTQDGSLTCIYLGGPSTVTMPSQRLTQKDTTQASWDLTYIPGWDLPRDTCFNGAGAGTETQTSGYLELSCTSAQALYYYIDGSSVPEIVADVATGTLIARYGIEILAGGSSATDRHCVELTLADTTGHCYRISARHEAAGWALYDTLAGPTRIGSAVVITGAIEVILSISDGKCASWYRQRSTNADRAWVAGPTSSSLTDGTTAHTSNRVLWGAKVTAASTVTAKWFELHIAGPSAGQGLSGGQTNPDELYPIDYAGPGYASSLTAGAQLTARGGPALYGETFQVATSYGYPLDRIRQSVSTSPRRGWRSTGVGSQVTIAFALDPVNPTTTAALMSDVLAVMATGCNWRTGKIQGYNGSAWVDLATLDTSEGMAFSSSFARYGNTLVAAPPFATTGKYIHENELSGWTAILSSTKWRRVVGNSAGSVVSSSTEAKRLVVELEGIDGTEATSGLTVHFVPDRWACLIGLKGVKYSGFRLLIDAQTCVDDYFTIGSLMIGAFRPWGHQPSRGRTIETAPSVAIQETPDGIRSSRVIGPPARTVDVSWVEGVDTSQVWNDSVVPDWIDGSTTAGSKPLATARGTPLVMEGMFRGMFRDGAGENPGVVGYLPAVGRVTDGDDVQVINRRHSLIVATIDDQSLRIETALGDENSSEVHRVATVSMRELV